MANIENDRMTDFIIRYKKIFTRDECRDIIEHIEFFDENSLLYSLLSQFISVGDKFKVAFKEIQSYSSKYLLLFSN